MFSVITPAVNRQLLTIEELRWAVGAQGNASDAFLSSIEPRAALTICSYCRVARAGIAIPTLRDEKVQDVVRDADGKSKILLSRMFVSAIQSVTEGTTALLPEEYEIDQSSGILLRLSDGYPSVWPSNPVTVIYNAGFTTVPDDIKAAASRIVADHFNASGRDPGLKREYVIGVGEYEYFGTAKPNAPLPSDVASMLAPYRRPLQF